MGLFSSETVITVSSTAVNLVGTPPDTNKAAVTQAILQKTSIPDEMMDSALSGIGNNVTKMYKYAVNTYVLGTPNGYTAGLDQAQPSTVTAVIEQQIGQEIALIYAFNDILTPSMAAIEFLRTERGIKLSTNEITKHTFNIHDNGQPLFLYKGEYLASTNQIKLTYRQEYMTVLQVSYAEFSDVIPMPSGVYLGEDYCMAAYNILDETGAILPDEYYWLYRLSDETIPDLTYSSTPFGTESFLPVVPLRKDNKDLTENKDTELYTTSKKLLSIASLDIDQLATTLNSNPNISEIDHAYVMFGINIHTKEQASLYYLCSFFDYLADQSVFKQQHYTNTLLDQTPFGITKNRLSIINLFLNRDHVALKEYGLNISLSYSYIKSTFVSGKIGAIGYITSTRKINDIVFRIQVSEIVYKEIYICNLVHRNTIYQGHAVVSTLSNSVNNENFIIPIHYGISSNMPLMKRNAMYYDSFRMVINSYDVQEVKWYQTGIFKVIFFVGAVVISIYTGGAGSWLAGLAVAAEAGVMAVIIYVLPTLLIGLSVTYGMKFVAKLTGAKFALILGAIAAIAAVSIGQNSSFSLMGENMPTASTLLQCSKAVMDAGNEMIYQETLDVMKDIEQFDAYANEKMTALEEAQKLLQTNEDLNPLQMIVFSPPYLAVPSESPEAFYNRTIHNTNIGVLCLDVIENYADIMLKLPEAKYS